MEVLLLWHLDQPGYGSARAGRPLLPWVRLHATKDYLDMAERVLARPELAVTLNVVPSLLEQLAACAAGIGDPELDLTRADPASFDAPARAAALDRLTVVPGWARQRFPALDRLAARRRPGSPPLDDAELLDLQVLHILAWIDPGYYRRPTLAPLVARGSGYTSAERASALAVAADLVGDVVPRLRALTAGGRAEVSVTPFYHPILPLLVDVKSAHRALHHLALPHESFAHPEDARAQLRAARRTFARVFEREPVGLWPSEGSVSPEVVAMAGEEGFRWLATDEEVLRHSKGARVGEELAHYRPWRVGGKGPWVFFRDRRLSDLVGFGYSRWAARDAVADFLGHLARTRERWRGEFPARVVVALDGENCWEHFPDDGNEFLERLYDALTDTPWIRTTTPAEVVRGMPEAGGGTRAPVPAAPAPGTLAGLVDPAPVAPAGTLEEIHSGSWIGASFRIWIGHAEKNRAWDAVARARAALVAAHPETGAGAPESAFWDGVEPVWGEDLGGPVPETPADRLRQAWRHLLIAEGSDWCWWYGDDHFTLDKPIFDRLLREHLMRVYELIGWLVPADLRVAFGRIPVAEERLTPLGLLAPNINGRLTHYYEWDLAGRWRPAGAGGAMRGGDRVTAVYYGFDEENLYARVDLEAESSDLTLALEFLDPPGYRIELEHGSAVRMRKPAPGRAEGPEAAPAGVQGAWDQICELAVPYRHLGVQPGKTVSWIVLLERAGHVVSSVPETGPISMLIPGPDASAIFWYA